MKSVFKHRRLHALAALLLLCLVLGSQFGPTRSLAGTLAQQTVGGQSRFPTFLPIVMNGIRLQTYLPLVMKGGLIPESIFGWQMAAIRQDRRLTLTGEANVSWVRYTALPWAAVEPTPGERNWAAVADLEAQLLNAARLGTRVILVVHRTPGWAQKLPGVACGPMTPETIPAFAAFMRDAVARYSADPYHVRHWEIWNEPDVDPSLVDTTSVFGCWGDRSDEYYGGGYYAEMLKAVYPAVKAADPRSEVIVGGLLLDCDPRLPDSCVDPLPPKFLEGILRNGGAAAFDGLAFHAYDFFKNSPPVEVGLYANRGFQAAYNTTGPVVIPKAQFVKQMLERYGVTGKYLMNTESALICGAPVEPPGGPGCERSPDSAYEITKAYYVTEAYASAAAEGLRANIWYSLEGWRNSGLVDSMRRGFEPRPGYQSFRFARQELGDATFTRRLDEYADVLFGFEFARHDRRVWVLWSRDRTERAITLPLHPLAVYDPFGNSLPATNPLVVGVMPVYVELNP